MWAFLTQAWGADRFSPSSFRLLPPHTGRVKGRRGENMRFASGVPWGALCLRYDLWFLFLLSGFKAGVTTVPQFQVWNGDAKGEVLVGADEAALKGLIGGLKTAPAPMSMEETAAAVRLSHKQSTILPHLPRHAPVLPRSGWAY